MITARDITKEIQNLELLKEGINFCIGSLNAKKKFITAYKREPVYSPVELNLSTSIKDLLEADILDYASGNADNIKSLVILSDYLEQQ